jgi:hypothetical protein
MPRNNILQARYRQSSTKRTQRDCDAQKCPETGFEGDVGAVVGEFGGVEGGFVD